MAAANKNNTKTATASLLIYLGMYILAPFVCLASQGIYRMCPICIQCCKSKMAAKMSAEYMKHYNNHKQTHLSMAYVRRTVSFSICTSYTRYNSLKTVQSSHKSTSSLSTSSSVALNFLSICCSTLPFHDTHRKWCITFKQFQTCIWQLCMAGPLHNRT